MSRDRRSRGVALPILISLLLHLLAFTAFSLQALWPVRPAESRPPAFRVVSVELPKPEEAVPENPESRLLSDANRKESGEALSGPGRLPREAEEKVPARRGAPQEPQASLPPSPPSPPAPAVQAVPPAPREPAPKPPEPEAKPPEPKPEPEAKPPEPKPEPPQPARPPTPRPGPRQEQARAIPPKEEPKPEPPKRAEPKKEEPKKEEPKPRPQQARPPQRPAPPQDPLAMFRARPKGRLDAPNIKLSDEEADRIARASLEKDLKKEEIGEAVSLDTRDFRFASYFAHIKEQIQKNWSWPHEARDYSGKLVLRFILSADGRLRQVELLTSSGYRILDDEALSAVTKAAPFKPFPSGLGRKFLNIEGTFVYEHAGRRVVP